MAVAFQGCFVTGSILCKGVTVWESGREGGSFREPIHKQFYSK